MLRRFALAFLIALLPSLASAQFLSPDSRPRPHSPIYNSSATALKSFTIGTPSAVTGQLSFLNSTNNNITTLQAGAASASKTYTWPLTTGSAGAVLTDAAGNGTLSWAVPTVTALTVGTTGVTGGSAGNLLYTDGSLLQAGASTVFATNQLDLRNGATAQIFRVCNTFTSATSFECGVMDFSSVANVLLVGTTKGSGGGSVRNMEFEIGGTNQLDFGVTTASTWTTPSALVAGTLETTATSNSGNTVFVGGTIWGLGHGSVTSLDFWQTSTWIASVIPQGFLVTSTRLFNFCANATFGGCAVDAAVGRNAAGIVEIDSGTLGTFRDLSLRHLRGNGAPTASACTGFVLATGSSDLAGSVTFNSATSCAISFAAAFTNAPFCVVSPGSAASTTEATTTTGVLTATFGTAQTAMSYQCMGL